MSIQTIKNAEKFCVFVFIFFSSVTLYGSELMRPATAMEEKSWRVSFSGNLVKTEPVFEISKNNDFQVPNSGGQTIFSSVDADISFEEEYETLLAAFEFRPSDEGLMYRLKMGQIRNFDIQFASGGHTNTIEATKNGFVWGGGVSLNSAPGSIVSTAVTLDLSFSQTIADLDRFESNGTISAVNHRFTQEDYQLAVNMSRRWKKWEPYGGLKIRRVVSKLSDQDTKGSVRGEDDQLSPFIGFQYDLFQKEKLVIEVSFVDEEMISAGLNINF